MNQAICKAIAEKRLLSFTYEGFNRIVEPHTYGVTTAGNEAIRCYQVRGSGSDGRSTGWHLMTLSKISFLSFLEETFPKPRDNYRRNDRDMSAIYAQL